MKDQYVLLPGPQRLDLLGDWFRLSQNGLIVLDCPDAGSIRFSALALQAGLLEKAGLNWEITAGTTVPTGRSAIVLSVVPGSVGHPQGYELTVRPDRAYAVAGSPVGIFYAVQTLLQLLTQSGDRLPTLRCSDWPDFPQRGVMLDISRDKVPTMETLFELVDLLASWKINQFQLYTEHTFAYRDHGVVWAEASPVTGEEILALDAYCRERFVELVPNQNSFGHMHRWLVHDEYRPLAECPQDCETDPAHFDQPFSLSPADPGSLKLVSGLYDELLPHFSSRQFNVGCDETFDLGLGRSKALVAEQGAGRVYLEFLLKIYQQVKARGYTMQFWGDIIRDYPELVGELPRDIIALEWGYEADHKFDEFGALFARSGIPFYVCPGTSSWNSIAGRTHNALGNLRNAAENGRSHGAVGYLNTDWGDDGHWQPLPVSYLGFAYGAAVSWAGELNRDMDVAAVLDTFAFQDSAGLMGRIAYDLGNSHEGLTHPIPNGTLLFRALQKTSPQIAAYVKTGAGDGELVQRLRATLATIDEVLAPLPQSQMQRADAELIKREFAWAGAMLSHGCQRAIWALAGAPANDEPSLRLKLAGEAEWLLSEHEAIWHARNRPGGFADSQARLMKMSQAYSDNQR